VICTIVILSMKYLQLFFPPRTVTLNYILAQTLGAVIGCAAYLVWHERIGRVECSRDVARPFVMALWLYTGALCLFVLMPLDFALNVTDLRTQLDRLPETLLAWPGTERPVAVQALSLLAATAAFAPVGVLLTFLEQDVYRVRRSLPRVAGLGLLLTTGLYGLASLVMGALPSMLSILYRTIGIVTGAVIIRWLLRQQPIALRQRLNRLVPWAVPPYLLCLLLANRILSVHWLSWSQAVAQLYPLGLLPLFDYYIVTKAEAAKNIVGHAVMYLPIGILLWLRYGDSGGRSFVVAAGLSFAVEVGRYFRPGLEGDFNAVVVAGLASLFAARMMPMVWFATQALMDQSSTATEMELKPIRGEQGVAVAGRETELRPIRGERGIAAAGSDDQ
jgi:VanZ family protein